jgi:glycosyltransferase involved in cell wall biosynthesis
MSVRISIVIPTANRREPVLRAVETSLQQDFPASDYEIIVVIDGADEGTALALRNLDAGHRLGVVELETNRGPSAARNAGWRAASGALIIFLDDDMLCTPGLVRAHVSAHLEVAGKRDIAGFGAIYNAPERHRTLAAETFRLGLGAVYLRHRDQPSAAWPENVWSFANTSVSRSVLERVGGFDERFRKREDSELGARLLNIGVRQQFVPDAVAYQGSEKNVQQLIHDAEVSAECDLLFLQIHPGRIPHEFVTHLRNERPWKRRARRVLSRNLAFTDLLLSPLCSMGELQAIPGPLRRVALRALLFRCGLHWYRKMTEIFDIENGAAGMGPRA